MNLHDILADSRIDMAVVSHYLDSLSNPERIAEIRGMNAHEQQRLFQAAEGFLPLDLNFFTPSERPPLMEVVHFGRNSLPAFTLFQKRFCLPDRETPEPQRWGYNHQPLSTFTGPGYFIAKPSTHGEVVIDYYQVPPHKPAMWPPILDNSARLSRFIYYHTRDYMRGVSRHVSIGRAEREGKWMNNWFVLCREDLGGQPTLADDVAYKMEPLAAPRLAGTGLRIMAHLAEKPVIGSLVSRIMLTNANIYVLRSVPSSEPVASDITLPPPVKKGKKTTKLDIDAVASTEVASPKGSFRRETAADFVAAYRQGKTTPVEVAHRVLDAIRTGDTLEPPMRTFIAFDPKDLLAQAEASAARYQAGKPLGPLDGVPVAVKDELNQVPYPTTVGTRFLGRVPVTEDAEVVARLRKAGALLIGKANMHEIGMGITGVNPHHGAARNPYQPHHVTGGSSSGSAAAVASGLCPIAIGADGGGSIRIPAAFCGVTGLKATFGRISEQGAAPLCWSVAHVGPIAATATDTALAYAVMAGPDSKDANSMRQPPVDMDGFGAGSLEGMTLGIYSPWFEDADPQVVALCLEAVKRLEGAGATVKEIAIPELGLLRTAHLVTIISEMVTAHLEYYALNRREYGCDTRVNFVLGRSLQGYDYVHAQRHRQRLNQHFMRVLEEVDGIVTPATGVPAPPVSKDALRTGESNLEMTDRVMRFAAAANLTGLPAISFPAGYTKEGLPVGLQVMGRPWEESKLLAIAAEAEKATPLTKPRVLFQFLPPEK